MPSHPCGAGLATQDWRFSSFGGTAGPKGAIGSIRAGALWGGICRTCSQGCMWRLDHAQESSWPRHGYAPGHHLPADGCGWWHLCGLLPAQLPPSPCCSLLYSGTEAFDFPFLVFLPVPEGVKQCLGPSSAATRAGSESCSMEGHQLLWGMICSPHCSLPCSLERASSSWSSMLPWSWLVSFCTCKQGRTLGRVVGKLAEHQRDFCVVVRSFWSL